jgi:transposase InsO family protein
LPERDGIRLPVITVHRVLARHGLVLDQERRKQATKRFERERPNELWQMDFKGQKDSHAAIGLLSVLDDHSRYLVAFICRAFSPCIFGCSIHGASPHAGMYRAVGAGVLT